MAADLAISIATPFIEYLIAPVGRQCGYILFYRRYLRELEGGVDKLKDELEGIEHQCQAARRNSMNIEKKATKWIDDVNIAVKEANALLLLRTEQPAGAANTANQSWFKRCVCLDHPPVTLSQQDAVPSQNVDLAARKKFYLNPVVRYKKGRKAKKTMLVIQGLNEDKKNLGEISYEASTTPILSLKDYQSFRSRKEIVDNIMRALSDTEAPSIGVWGMGGVGKSTLMKEIMRLARDSNLFADVAMADVSHNPNVKKIQGELARWLDLKLKDDEDVSVRADRLREKMKPTDKMKGTAESLKKQNAIRPEENQDGRRGGRKKSTAAPEPVEEGRPEVKQKQVLIILDNIWRRLDLEEIGIPLDGGAVKLLFTSRKQHVLSSEMNCSQNVFKLEVLMDGEPWRLFESIVGEIVTPDSRFRSIGEEVVQKCSGLPIVLKAIATTLRNCSLQEWEDALVQFKGSKDAYSNLEISYKHLESEELKSLFLVCALTNRASIYVQDVLYYCMGLRLLKGTNTVRSARGKLIALLHDLQDSSLLLKHDGRDPDYVHIHDVVREVAIGIASRDQHSHLITDEFELKEISKEKVKNSKAISIPYVKFRKLPEGWECPKLKMFLLYGKVDDPPIGISDSFFEGMKELSVLEITGRSFDSLPLSIQLLLNLNTLCLDGCSIEDLTIIGKLKQLQILTFRGSEIARLPKEIGELSELKVLNLENSKLEVIEPQVLGKLTSLEELRLKGSSFKGWEDEGEMQPSNAKLSELNSLSKLSTVNIHIHNPSTFPKHLEFGNLAEYIIQIGDVWDWAGDYKESRILKIKLELCRNSFLHEKWVQDLLKRTQNLQLDGIKSWQRSIHELCLDGFQELKHLCLQNSPLIQCVARSISKWLPCTAFIILESLFLKKLAGLEMISRGPISSESFSKLKVIRVIDCGKLKSVFSYSMLKNLSQLVEIEVRDCEAMQVIVTVDSVATSTEAVKLESLHRIELHNLPNIVTFSSIHRVEVVDMAEVNPRSSEIIQEEPCIPANTMFPNDQLVLFPLLKSLILSSLPKLKYIWQNNCPVDQVANMEHLEVSSCDELLIVIPSSLVKEVTKLETLMVGDCGSLQEVFETSDDDALNLTSDDMEILSRLKILELSNLPFLRHIWETNHQLEKMRAFPNLNSLKVRKCSSLTNLLPAALLQSLNQLTEIYIKSCKEMKAVVPPENDGIRSGEAKNIVFEDLPNMVTSVWTQRGESISFISMKELYIKECPKMRSFSLVKEDERAHDELCFFDNKVQLPKLVRLDLISLRSIQNIWDEEIHEESNFCSLEILVVKDCEALVDVIPSMNMTAAGIGRLQFHNLKEIVIKECTSLEQPIFKFAEGEGHYYPLSQLEKLWLFHLPKLEYVVQPDSHVVVGFPSLVNIEVADCKCVVELFPIATATTLSKLQDLKVGRCSSMRRIFGKDEAEAAEDDEMLDSILFPCLRSMLIQKLDSLISLFMGISCTLGFPSLETLDVSLCSKLKTFNQSHANDQMLEQSYPFRKQDVHYLFDDKVELPNLQKMELVQLNSLQTIWKKNELIPSNSDSCSRLKSLTVLECKDLHYIFTASFASNLAQLEELSIDSCEALEEIVMEGDDGSREELEGVNSSQWLFFPLLTSLELCDLPNLRSIFRGSNVSTWSALKDVSVWHCDKVQIFTSKFSSENSSTRQSLFSSAEQVIPKLEILRLVEEDAMRIHDEEFKEDIFSELKYFSLSCFHNERAAGFPLRFLLENSFQKLEGLTVFCSSFEEIFADKSLSPQEIISYKERFAFSGEGNKKPLARLTAIKLAKLDNLKHVCKADMTVFAEILKSIQILEVADCPNLKRLFTTASCSFGNITTIEVHICNGLKELVTSSAATSLVKLTQLDIYDCGMIETIVSPDESKPEEEEEEEEEGELLVICFRELKHIGLHRLPSLTSFSSANCIFELPSLEQVIVIKCPNLKVFSSNTVVAPKLSKVLLTEEEETDDQVRWDGDLNTTIQNLPKS